MSWKDLEGWDSASPENEARCRKFQSAEYENSGLKLKYRYFRADSGEESLPLVVYLHGADAIGTDNERQLSLHDIGTVFADEAWQEKHPSHILAPQFAPGSHWARPQMLSWLQALVRSCVKAFAADPARIYIYGYSAGAIGLLSLIKRNPDYYAAAIPICGSTEGADLEKLLRTPMWFIHAADDPIVHAGRGASPGRRIEHLGSFDLYAALKELTRDEDRFRHTWYAEGEMMGTYHLHPHCTWVLAGENTEAKEWLFVQKRRCINTKFR